jgi:hypothetical protein
MSGIDDENRKEKDSSAKRNSSNRSKVKKPAKKALGHPKRPIGKRAEDESETNIGRLGFEAATALELWHRFSRDSPDFHLTGNRTDSHGIELVSIIENEEASLAAFCESQRLDGVALLAQLADEGIDRGQGSEHDVYVDRRRELVFKATRGGKYGRRWATPSMYLNRLAHMNSLAPYLKIRFHDFLVGPNDSAILTSMVYFPGRHPSQRQVGQYLKGLGFEKYSDESETLDFLHPRFGLILRDCHPQNWVVYEGSLVPIDIIPEILRATPR